MNTFYGEMGNPNSTFFIVTMAGGVTQKGRESTIAAQKFVENLGCKVLYGDTDSIYVTQSEKYFKEIDQKYAKGLINKVEFFEQMVEITMEKTDLLLEDLSEHLKNSLEGNF